MKRTWYLLGAVCLSFKVGAACLSCGGGGDSPSQDTGPSFAISLGNAQFGQSVGDLTFGCSMPTPGLFTPELLRFDALNRPDVTVITTNVINALTNATIGSQVQITTNYLVITNNLGGAGIYIVTNVAYSVALVNVTNTITIYATNTVLRQICAPQALADIPPPPTTNGYVINFYYASQVGGQNPDGTYQTSGIPFATWLITNAASPGVNRLQVSQTTPADGLLKWWDYNYSTNTGTWRLTTLAGVQKDMAITNLNDGTYQVVNSLQYTNGPVALQARTTYQVFSWGVAPVRIDIGSNDAPQTTTYTYYDPSAFNAGTLALPQIVTHPDGAQEYYLGYNTNGRPTGVYSTIQDNPYGRYTSYDYDPNDAVPGSGDDGALFSEEPRRVVESVNGYEVSRRYTVYASTGLRLDIQCTTAGANWDDPQNLVTTNLFYTNGPNQFALRAVIAPDGTMTTYDYSSGTYRTNITVTGRPDATYSHIVDGTSNRVVVNVWGGRVSSATWDVASGGLLAQDTYGNYDSYGRPQHVTHLDGTSETNVYDCCGLSYTVDRDGVDTVYLYDADRRQYGYQRYDYGANPITYQNVLDAAGRAVKSLRLGTNGSSLTRSQSAYDTAGRLIAQTNALNGKTSYVESTAPGTGGRIRTTTYPDGGTRIENYYLDGSLKSVTGTAVHPVRYEYGAEYDASYNSCSYTLEIKLNPDGSDSSEWTKTYTDMAGRTTEVLYSDYHYSQSFYNARGQLWKQVDPDGVTTLYQYNAKGELAYTAVDLNQNDTIDFSGADRINWTTNDVTIDHGTTVRRSRTYVWAQNGVNASSLLSLSETSADGLKSWQVNYADASHAVTNSTVTSYAGGSRTTIATAPDGSYTINAYAYGRLVSSARYDSASAPMGGTAYTYDAHGRQYQVTDARNGATTYGYNHADQVNSVTTPNPGGGSAETTTTAYDSMLRPYSVTQPDGTTVSTVYLLTGELGKQYGSRTYPVAYSYDYAGRMQTMTNWSNYAGNSGARVTTWLYDAYRGWLNQKQYPDGHGPAYAYTPAGRLQQRSWVRGVDTTYAYDPAGGLTNLVYSDGTPGVTNVYDRLGRLSSVRWTNLTDTLTYNLANELLTEAFSGGVLNGLSVTNGYDQCLRRTNLTALGSGVLSRTAYGYDNASRLATVNDGNGDTANYSYLANSPLVSQIVFQQSGVTRMTTTKQYDYLNRLTAIASQPSGTGVPPVSFNYSYNSANQRTKNVLADGSYWIYQYDNLGQVTNGVKYFSDGTLVPGQQFGYGFDDIGNRQQTTAGGDSTGAGKRLANYTVNSLNQITQRDYPGTNDIIGAALATNSVTVNGQTAWRKGEYFWAMVKSNNTASAQWEGITVVSGGNTNNGNLYVPKTPEQFSYDADGNLTNDGHFAYTWDGENRLIAATNSSGVGPNYGLKFAYDPQGRRIQKQVVSNSVSISTNRFLYDGWNLIAELKPNNSLVRSYVWGTDLSGSQQGAGGVGGLLEVSCYGSSTTNCFPAFDGNGNAMNYINAADGTSVAQFEYDPFLGILRATGPMANLLPFLGSTKYYDWESGLYYYGYRYYKPSTGTWPNRDPMGEPGFMTLEHPRLNFDSGPNPYDYVGDNPINALDPLGLAYGNPVSGPNGPIGPSDPYAPGGPYGPVYNPPPPSCREACVLKYVLGITVDTTVVVSGQPIITKRFVLPGSAEGTSIAGQMTDAILQDAKLPGRLPTISGGWKCCRIAYTKSASRFVSRWIPFVGWALLDYDLSGMAGCMCGCPSN